MKLGQVFRGAMLSCVCVTLLAACLGGARESPKKHYFALSVDRPASTADVETGVRHDATLAVRRARVAPAYEGRGLVYRRGEAEYQSDFYNEFIVSPSALLTEDVRRSLADARLFRNVVDAASAVSSDVELEIVVNELYGDFRDSAHPTAVLEVEFFLLRENGDQVLGHWVHRADVHIDHAGASELVDGWNDGLKTILEALVRDLDGVDLARP